MEYNKLQALTVFSILFGFAICMVILTLKNGQTSYNIWMVLAVIDAILLTEYYKQLSNK